jgi:hypothetical protein
MAPQRWDDDAALLVDLVEAMAEPGEIPDGFVEAGVAALAWRTVDAELTLAELVFDSDDAPQLSTSVRSGGSSRMLAFSGGGFALEIETSGAGIVGQLTPAGDGRVTCQTPAGPTAEATVDPAGYFILGPPPSGPVRLAVCTAGHTIVTSWTCLR